jgi:3-oxoacyl-[acyl-carrier protein] reductase
MLNSDFGGKTAVVTGSASGLGRILSLMLAAGGANIVINARKSQDLLDATVTEARSQGANAIGVLADVSKPEQVDFLARETVNAFGRVDILVNNAGIRPLGSILNLTFEDWLDIIGVKVNGAFLCSQQFLPLMVENGYGRIINISGIDGFWGNARKTHVGTANMGLIGLTRALAVEFAPHGITVNAVVPGAFDTERPHGDQWYGGRDFSALAKRIPMGRLGRPEELAAVCRFLVHEEASYITGQTIHVNGGAYPTR